MTGAVTRSFPSEVRSAGDIAFFQLSVVHSRLVVNSRKCSDLTVLLMLDKVRYCTLPRRVVS